MFLGIRYNQWHGIIAFALTILVFFIMQSWALAELLASLLICLFLQAMNESLQAIDRNLISKYGSLESFQDDSRADWRWMLGGWVIGAVIGSLFF